MSIKHLVTGSLLALAVIGSAVPVWSDETADGWEKVVFHVDDTANARWALMLANAYLDDSPKAKLVVVTYGPGIDFLLEDAEDRRGEPYAFAVSNLVEKGVKFSVCNETLHARSIDKEKVLDTVTIVPSGISEIARLQIKEGYAYLKP